MDERTPPPPKKGGGGIQKWRENLKEAKHLLGNDDDRRWYKQGAITQSMKATEEARQYPATDVGDESKHPVT